MKIKFATIAVIIVTLCHIQANATDAISVATQGTDISHSHFTWGASIGSAIDMSGNDMSAIDISACFGYKGTGIQMAGVGASIDMVVNNSSRIFPVYAILRTNFQKKPSLCFMELKAGCAFNHLYDYDSQQGFYGSIGAGVNLATGHDFKSFITLSYTYNSAGSATYNTPAISDLHMAAISIGLSF
jgi:hypothetical protein